MASYPIQSKSGDYTRQHFKTFSVSWRSFSILY